MIAEVVGPGNRGDAERLKRASETISNTSDGKNNAFEDIDALFSDDDIADHAKQIASTPSAAETVQSSERTTAQPRDAATTQWQREKRGSSKGDEKLGRNGIGLLILATGLAALPFFAGSVKELTWLIPYLPGAALTIAFLGTFLLAISKRRRGCGTIILSLFPFVFIAMACAGGYFYSKYILPSTPVEIAQQNEEEGVVGVGERGNVDDPGPLPGDRITIDRDAINNNPAAKFVPRRGDPKADKQPAPQPDERRPTGSAVRAEADGFQVAPSGRPGRREEFQPFAIPANAEAETNRSERIILPGSKKRNSLLQRADKIKALVSRGEFHGADERCEGCSISKVIGEATVYGVAFIADEIPIRGFDFLGSSSNATLEIVAPFSGGQPLFDDSQFSRDEKMVLQGFNINRQNDEGVIGLQGIYSDGLGRTELGSWIGRAATDDEFSSIRIEADQRLTGFVLYRHRFRTVGIGLVVR